MKIFYIITTFVWATVCLAVRQQLTFHSELDCTGNGVIFQSKQPILVPEECAAPIVSTHRSFSAIGLWGLYRDENYGHSFDFVGKENSVCYNRTAQPLQSFRYHGPPDTRTHSISLYEGINMGGHEMTITGPAFANIPFGPRSFFITGNTSWTFYTGNNFDGTETCYTPPNGFWWTTGGLNSHVGSILRGCNGRVDHYFVS